MNNLKAACVDDAAVERALAARPWGPDGASVLDLLGLATRPVRLAMRAALEAARLPVAQAGTVEAMEAAVSVVLHELQNPGQTDTLIAIRDGLVKALPYLVSPPGAPLTVDPESSEWRLVEKVERPTGKWRPRIDTDNPISPPELPEMETVSRWKRTEYAHTTDGKPPARLTVGHAEPVAWMNLKTFKHQLESLSRGERLAAHRAVHTAPMRDDDVALYTHPPVAGEADEAMALHWIDRYASGIDAEPRFDLIADALSGRGAGEAVRIGVLKAAAYVQKKANDYALENCESECDTGAAVYRYGQAGEDYHHSLLELAEELLALAETATPAAKESK